MDDQQEEKIRVLTEETKTLKNNLALVTRRLHDEVACITDRMDTLEEDKIRHLEEGREQLDRKVEAARRERTAFVLAVFALFVLTFDIEGDLQGHHYSLGGRHLTEGGRNAIAALLAATSGFALTGVRVSDILTLRRG